MRLASTLLAATLLVAPFASFAQATAPAPAAPAPTMAAPVSPSPAEATPARKLKHSKRMTLQQRFDTANTTHDGHLTRDQVTAAKWGYVNKHFDSIDADHKGFVTVEDIHGFAKAAHATRAAHRTMTPATPAAPATTTN